MSVGFGRVCDIHFACFPVDSVVVVVVFGVMITLGKDSGQQTSCRNIIMIQSWKSKHLAGYIGRLLGVLKIHKLLGTH